MPTVAIGGINTDNAGELLKGSQTGSLYLDGLAIVSAIMAADDPKATCQQFADIIQTSKQLSVKKDVTAEAVIKYAIQAMKSIKSKGPMVHHITSMYELLMKLYTHMFNRLRCY